MVVTENNLDIGNLCTDTTANIEVEGVTLLIVTIQAIISCSCVGTSCSKSVFVGESELHDRSCISKELCVAVKCIALNCIDGNIDGKLRVLVITSNPAKTSYINMLAAKQGAHINTGN